jgi:hypothetical protein
MLLTLLGGRCGIAMLMEVVWVVFVFLDILIFEVIVIVILVVAWVLWLVLWILENFLRRNKSCVSLGVWDSWILSEGLLLRPTCLLIYDHNRGTLFHTAQFRLRS